MARSGASSLHQTASGNQTLSELQNVNGSASSNNDQFSANFIENSASGVLAPSGQQSIGGHLRRYLRNRM
jgi:hypothetical protein